MASSASTRRRSLPSTEADQGLMTPYESYADEVLGRARVAAEAFKKLDQPDVDRIVEAAFRAAFDARIELARLAADETGIGVFEHKVLKNAWASLLIYEQIRGRRTVGVAGARCAQRAHRDRQPRGPGARHHPAHEPHLDRHLQGPHLPQDAESDDPESRIARRGSARARRRASSAKRRFSPARRPTRFRSSRRRRSSTSTRS